MHYMAFVGVSCGCSTMGKTSQPFCGSLLAESQLKLRGSALCCNHGGLQHVSALVSSSIATAQLFQEASWGGWGTQPVPLALSIVVLLAAPGAVDGVQSGAKYVLQGSCFVIFSVRKPVQCSWSKAAQAGCPSCCRDTQPMLSAPSPGALCATAGL